MTVTAIWIQSACNQLHVRGAAENEKKKKKKRVGEEDKEDGE